MDPNVTPEQREEAWRQYHADQLQQQTRHLERIRTYTGALLVIVVVLIVLQLIAAIAVNA